MKCVHVLCGVNGLCRGVNGSRKQSVIVISHTSLSPPSKVPSFNYPEFTGT